MTRPAAIWQVPLLILAGATAIAGLGMGVASHFIPAPWGMAIAWALAGASLTFIVARVVHAGAVTRRELELVVLALGVFVAPIFVIAGIGILVVGMGALVVDELERVFARGVEAVLGTSHAPPSHEADPEDLE